MFNLNFACCGRRGRTADINVSNKADAEEKGSLLTPRLNRNQRDLIDKCVDCFGCCGGRCSRTKWCIGLLIYALITFLFFPREPVWDVKYLKLANFSLHALRSLPDTSKPAVFQLIVQAQASNPNLIGASTLPGDFWVHYADQSGKEHLIGHAGVRPLSIPGGTSVFPGGSAGSTMVTVDVEIVVMKALGMQMLEELLKTQFQLRLRVDGSVRAGSVAFKFYPIQANVECFVRANVGESMTVDKLISSAMKEDASLPPTEFSEKRCSYGYGLSKWR
jgi:hypothetical protein